MMDPTFVIAFLLCFAAGPLLYSRIVRVPAGRRFAVALALVVAMLCTFALNMRDTNLGLAWQLPQIATLLSLWLAWVVALALLARAFALRVTNRRWRRTATLSSLIATTLPWFGLATAQTMSI